MNTKTHAGWVALVTSVALSVEAAVARLFPDHSSSGSEAAIIASLLAFAAMAFGVAAYEDKAPKEAKEAKEEQKEQTKGKSKKS